MKQIYKFDIVALLVDVPESGLQRGDVGTIIEVFEPNAHHPGGYILEFVDKSGEVYAHLDVTDATQIMPLHFNFRREAA